MPLTFNASPYYNDYDQAKQFYDILFRPGFAVQARELTQLQSILEEQIRRFGQHIFKEGSMVIPGQVTYDQNFQYVKVNSTFSSNPVSWDDLDPSSDINQDVVVKLEGSTTGVIAQVVKVNSETNTVYVKYLNAGTDGETKVFADGEVLKVLPSDTSIAQAIDEDATGVTAAASIQEGVYFIFGRFVKVFAQTVLVADFDNLPSARIGLEVSESIVTPEDDQTLTDNATGYSNYAAPGAHRYKIDLVLKVKDLTAVDDENFVELIRVEGGKIQKIVDKTFYSEIEKTLARRTEDTNGSFAVRPFKLNLREHLLTGENGGVYTSLKGGDAAKLAVAVEPGKAYVQGYEIESIVTQFIPVDKARDTAYFSNSRTRTYLGNYIFVNRLFGLPNYDRLVTVNLYDVAITTDGVLPVATAIGTATIRNLEFAQGSYQSIGNPGPIFKAYLTDINITGSGKTINDIRSLGVSDGTLTTTANILSEVGIINPTGSFVAGSTITGSSLTETVYAWNTSDNTLLVRPSAGAIPVNTAITSSATGSATLSWRVMLQDIEDNILVFKLPQNGVSTVRDKSGSVTTTYSYRKVFNPATEAAGRVTFVVGTNEVFASISPSDFVACIETGTGAGTLIDVTNANPSLQSALTQLSFDAPSGTTVKLSATVVKQVASERTKTLVTTNKTVSDPVPNVINLGKCDCYRPVGIWTGVDDTGESLNDRYIFDTGQRSNMYDFGTLTLKPGVPAPSGGVYIEFEYFDHGGGDYFCVNSYNNFGSHTDWYERIPYFSLPDGTPLMLRDCLDFRSKRDESSPSTIVYPSGVGKPFKPNDDVITDFSYYLGRADKLYLDPQGHFQVLKGSPSLSPVPPSDPTDGGMVIATLRYGPYTFGPKDVLLKLIDNRRYTMRDIGRLERRIENLEYYTALNLLEKETASFLITDAATGLDRYKNGFVVDPFSDHKVADVYNPDNAYSIDSAKRQLRPMYKSSSHDILYNHGLSTDIEYRGVKTTNDVLTLPYTEVALIVQEKASRIENLNPYNVFNFTGTAQLDPSTDNWKDTELKPDVVVEDSSAYDSVMAALNGSRALGTIWNEWTTDWVGTTTDVVGTRSVASEPHTVPQPGNQAGPNGEWAGFEGIMRQTITDFDVVRTTKTTNQSRQGIVTEVTPKVTQQRVDDKIVNVALSPFIRSRDVSIKGLRLKPLTRHYVFFDEVDVNANCKPVSGDYGDSIVTNGAGELNAIFTIPAGKFRVGRRVLRVCDDVEARNDLVTSFADAQYNASGLIETRQKTITSVREAIVTKRTVSDKRVITSVSETETERKVTWIDPLAQSFLVDTLSGGYMVTGLDLFFATKDDNIPVTVQIREMENGIPTQRIVPFSEVTLNPSQVNVSTDASAATRFNFESPVYLQQGVEYAIVAMSNSNGYFAYVARLADRLLNSDRLISQVPYAGVLFKSQNASTWTPVQTEALKFTLYRAKFDTTKTGKALFFNDTLPVRSLKSLSLLTYNGTNVIRVLHPDHGMPPGSKVTLAIPAGAANANWDDSYNGIPVVDIVPTISGDMRTSAWASNVADTVLGSRTYTVANVELDSYTISIVDDAGAAVNATSSGYTGVALTVTENRLCDVLLPHIQELNFSGTRSDWFIRDVTGQSTHGDQVAYQRVKSGSFPYTSFVPNQNVYFDAPRVVASQVNETEVIKLGTTYDNKSLAYYVELTSSVDHLSPMIDSKRCAAIIVSHRIDNRIDGTTPSCNPTAAAASFVAETVATANTGPARYIHKPAALANPSNSIHVIVSTMRPPEATVELYYRILKTDTSGKFEEQPWVLMSAANGADLSASQSPTDFKDYYYAADDVGEFSTFATKIVMRSKNSCKIPIFKDFRAIALDQ